MTAHTPSALSKVCCAGAWEESRYGDVIYRKCADCGKRLEPWISVQPKPSAPSAWAHVPRGAHSTICEVCTSLATGLDAAVERGRQLERGAIYAHQGEHAPNFEDGWQPSQYECGCPITKDDFRRCPEHGKEKGWHRNRGPMLKED